MEATGKVTSGTYSVKDVDQIVLENYGTISDILINNTQAAFTLVRQGKAVWIDAQRAEQLSETDKTQVLDASHQTCSVLKGFRKVSICVRLTLLKTLVAIMMPAKAVSSTSCEPLRLMVIFWASCQV